MEFGQSIILNISSYRNTSANQMIFAHNPSMDVLQGLLVALSWVQHQSQHMRYSSYLHLAWSIVGDLRLDRVAETQQHYSRIAVSKVTSHPKSSRESVDEIRRALIGCYIATDRSLIYLARSQQIFELIDDAVVTTANSVQETDTDIHAFQSEIDEYKATLPAMFSENSLVQFHLHTLPLFLCYACLFDEHAKVNFPASSMPRPNGDAGLPPYLKSGQRPLDLSYFQVEFLNRGLTEAKRHSSTDQSYSMASNRLQPGSGLQTCCDGCKVCSMQPSVGALCLALNMPQVLRGVLERIQCLSKDTVTIDGKYHSNCFYEAWLWHILEYSRGNTTWCNLRI
ncbi:hypothetical protein N7449_011371 [Penicillium cf. viridicatum]|uniref:Transcription factor domain-containing protein n=1 Tax=Penicillium cf. viridicatum TaxID=2972119 RepID=A0A9W9M453_9EURO|nr:hypothetical protein N7449_011371 [Penicillium cf. viridicatum]